ncbi:hypothetical protein WUBG_09214 [Wuchereria bancrofti]|uniref:Uncharacterized protein n=1 Tax=Wuchereria bancrofti TaxID=6293 RepID=J9ECH0_WUCBA|nr:hypothetical protein WUBG_09214 [Wuchereria bancrofti]
MVLGTDFTNSDLQPGQCKSLNSRIRRGYGQLGGHRRPSSHLHLSKIVYSEWAKNVHFELSLNHKSRRQISSFQFQTLIFSFFLS